jgi:hypothetical protein
MYIVRFADDDCDEVPGCCLSSAFEVLLGINEWRDLKSREQRQSAGLQQRTPEDLSRLWPR